MKASTLISETAAIVNSTFFGIFFQCSLKSRLILWHIQTLSRTSASLYGKKAECFPSPCKIKTDWKRFLLKVAEMDERDFAVEMWAIQPPAQGYAVSRGAKLHEKYLPALATRPNNPEVKVVGSCSPQSEVKGTQSREDHLSPLFLHSIFPPFFPLLSSPDPLFVLPLLYLFDLFAEKKMTIRKLEGIGNTHARQEPERICRARGRHIHGSHGETQDKSLSSSCCSCRSPSCSLWLRCSDVSGRKQSGWREPSRFLASVVKLRARSHPPLVSSITSAGIPCRFCFPVLRHLVYSSTMRFECVSWNLFF